MPPLSVEARRRLRSSFAGELVTDGLASPRPYVIDGVEGWPILPVTPAELDAAEVVLFIPVECADALQLLLAWVPIEDDARCDRWRAYHGRPAQSRWVSARIESGRLGSGVFDGSALALPNPLYRDEPRLCREVNQTPGLAATLLPAGVATASRRVVVVGVDDEGLDLRVDRGLVRVEFPQRVSTAEQARAAIASLSRAGR